MRYFLLFPALLLAISCDGPMPISSVDGVNPPGLANELKTYAPTGSLTRGLDAPALLEDDEQIASVLNQLHQMLIDIIHDVVIYDTLPTSAPPEYRSFTTGQIDYVGLFTHRIANKGTFSSYSSANLSCELNDNTINDSFFWGGGLRVELNNKCCRKCYVSYQYEATFSGTLDMGGIYSGKVILEEIKTHWTGTPLMEGNLHFESDSASFSRTIDLRHPGAY